MPYGFKPPIAHVKTSDGLNVYLEQPLDYVAKNGTTVRAPVGTYTNGASTPSAVWTTFPPFGRYWLATVLHDAAYDNDLLIWNGTDFVKADLPKDQCDALLLEAMESLGVDLFTRNTIFEAVAHFGQPAFDAGRKAKPTVEQPQSLLF